MGNFLIFWFRKKFDVMHQKNKGNDPPQLLLFLHKCFHPAISDDIFGVESKLALEEKSADGMNVDETDKDLYW